MLVLLPAVLSAAGESPPLVVKTYPDGIRDDGIAYLYRDRISAYSFYLYAPDEPGDIYKPVENPIDMEGVSLSVRLPKGMNIVSYAFVDGPGLLSTHTRHEPAERHEDGDVCRWELPCGAEQVRYKFRPGRWGVDTKSVASRYHLYLYLEPERGFARDAFEMEWVFRRGDTPQAHGTTRIQLLPGPANRKNPKRFMLWTGLGAHRNVLGDREMDSALGLARECGATAILQAGVPFVILGDLKEPTRARIEAKGMSVVDMDTIYTALSPRRDDPLKDSENCAVDLTGARNVPGRRPSMVTIDWCPTMLATPGSDIFDRVIATLKARCDAGIRWFYIDLERDIYSQCFCSHCRAAFCRHARIAEKSILSLPALDLVQSHPVEWYTFRSWQTGEFFRAWKAALKAEYPDLMLGLNENISYPGVYTRGLGYGMIWFSEDPRFLDFGVDFHNTDTIKGGMEDIIRLDLRFRPQDSYGVAMTKPVIARAGSFCDVNWDHFCTLSGKAWADERQEPFGCDKRGELLELAIAHMAALGAKGVETSLTLDITDALVANAADRGMAFVAEFEDILLDGQRLADDQVDVYDLTDEPSPYDQIGPKSYYDRMYFHGPAKHYGFVQYKAHAGNPAPAGSVFSRLFRKPGNTERLVSLFNWDLYQHKALLVKLPGLPAGSYFVHVYRDGERRRWIRGGRETWSSEDLALGVSLDLDAGDVAAVHVSKRPLPDVAHTATDKGYSAAGTAPIDLYAWRTPIPEEPTIEAFEANIYNRNLKWIRQRFPDAVPDKYLKAAP